jgi:hypothetical protein
MHTRVFAKYGKPGDVEKDIEEFEKRVRKKVRWTTNS